MNSASCPLKVWALEESSSNESIIVKNTFLEVAEAAAEAPAYQSCPIAAFAGQGPDQGCEDLAAGDDAICGILTGSAMDLSLCDLAAAARVFSTGTYSREAMEMTGHINARAIPAVPTPLSQADLDLLCVDADAPEAPAWTPKIQYSQQCDKPSFSPLLCEAALLEAEAPTWTPKVSPCSSPVHSAPVSFPTPQMALNLQQAAPTLQMQATPSPALHNSPPQRTEHTFFRVAHPSGLALRTGPHFDAPRTGSTLAHNQIFSVSQEITAYDGRVYLRLADGQGWACDDTVVMPHNPSVVRGMWAPMGLSPTGLPFPSAPSGTWDPFGEPVAEPETQKKRRRRKRGGVKRNKAKRAAAAAAAGMKELEDGDSDSEIETDAPTSDALLSETEGSEPEPAALEEAGLLAR